MISSFKIAILKYMAVNSQIIYGGNGCYNIDILNCIFNDQMTVFTQRDMWIDNAMLALGNNDSQSGHRVLNIISKISAAHR